MKFDVPYLPQPLYIEETEFSLEQDQQPTETEIEVARVVTLWKRSTLYYWSRFIPIAITGGKFIWKGI